MIRALLKLAGLALLAASARPKDRNDPANSDPKPAPHDSRKAKTKRWMFRGAFILAALALGGFLVAASGVLPITASSRHWAITRWFLNFSKERSVATHSIGIKPPELDAPWRVLKGAGHFETGCRPCHGSPEMKTPRTAWAMTPQPPSLGKEVADWKPAELFYIVKHGIKFTGMPAWPAENRDDEVWAMVAFLQKLPHLDQHSYRKLVHGEATPDAGAPLQDLLPPAGIRQIVTQNCVRCHGADGNGRGTGAFPKLAGQKRAYLSASLAAYASGTRHSGIMEPIAAALQNTVIEQLADYYSALTGSPADTHQTNAFERGRKIAFHGIPEKLVPACAECHLADTGPKNAMYPNLNGQYREYLSLQLQLFKSGHRGGTSYEHIMREVAANLTDEEVDDVAAFFSSLPPRGRTQ